MRRATVAFTRTTRSRSLDIASPKGNHVRARTAQARARATERENRRTPPITDVYDRPAARAL
eukprot:3663696-Prymnesium_polylepis.1